MMDFLGRNKEARHASKGLLWVFEFQNKQEYSHLQDTNSHQMDCAEDGAAFT